MFNYYRLKDLREDLDLSQKQIADILNTSTQYYQKYEKGKFDLPLSRALILANFYNVSLDYLTGRTNNKEISPAKHTTGKPQRGINKENTEK